jgi:hypothetical protein
MRSFEEFDPGPNSTELATRMGGDLSDSLWKPLKLRPSLQHTIWGRIIDAFLWRSTDVFPSSKLLRRYRIDEPQARHRPRHS